MKKLLSLLFASTMALALTAPAFATNSTTNSTTPPAKTHKTKTVKTHKGKTTTAAKTPAPKAQ